MQSFDFIIVGSGIAGLSFAIQAAEKGSVALITKKNLAESNTNYAQGGIACVMSEEDSFDLHIKDTIVAGAGLCDEQVVRTIVSEAPEKIKKLMELNLHFSEREGRHELDLGKEGGHSKRRILHAGDITGREIERALVEKIRQLKNISIFENHYAVDLITTHKLNLHTNEANRCLGLYALNNEDNRVIVFRGAVTILATGGCGKCYLYTTNPTVATGDGVAMAYRAGTSIGNMEFIQFHPTCLYDPKLPSFLISEALRGEGGVLRNSKGEDFTRQHNSLGSLAPRDIVARAIDAEMKSTGVDHVYLDMTHHSREFLSHRFPNIDQTCLAAGIDMAKQPIPVVPAAHYQCGGVLTDMQGETNLIGLWAIGEVACTGLHGANRLASNSLLEALVMAYRAFSDSSQKLEDLRHDIALPAWQEGSAHHPDELVVITHNWREIRELMWDYVGIVRTNKRLQRARKRLQMLMDEIQEYYWDFKVTGDLLELRNLALVSHLIVESALLRKESRGLHYTMDYPEMLPLAENTVLEKS